MGGCASTQQDDDSVPAGNASRSNKTPAIGNSAREKPAPVTIRTPRLPRRASQQSDTHGDTEAEQALAAAEEKEQKLAQSVESLVERVEEYQSKVAKEAETLRKARTALEGIECGHGTGAKAGDSTDLALIEEHKFQLGE